MKSDDRKKDKPQPPEHPQGPPIKPLDDPQPPGVPENPGDKPKP